MKVYYITTYATEDKPQMTCSYPFGQWIETIKGLKEVGRDFHAWEEVSVPQYCCYE